MILLGICSEVKWKLLSCVWLFVTLWTTHSVEFSRPGYWSGLPFPSTGDLPIPGIEPRSPSLQVGSLPAEPQWDMSPGEGNDGPLQCSRQENSMDRAAWQTMGSQRVRHDWATHSHTQLDSRSSSDLIRFWICLSISYLCLSLGWFCSLMIIRWFSTSF